jgi:hypothetical protein
VVRIPPSPPILKTIIFGIKKMNVNDLVMVISVGDYVEISFLIGHSGTIVQISNETIIQLVDDSYIVNDDNKKLFVVEFDEEIEVLSDEQIPFKTKYIGFVKT